MNLSSIISAQFYRRNFHISRRNFQFSVPLRPLVPIRLLLSLLVLLCSTVNAQTPLITAEKVLELALSSPVFMNESSAKLHLAEGELEVARRWWIPTTTAGFTNFSRTGNALNSDGFIFNNVEAKSAQIGWGINFNADGAKGFTGVEKARHGLFATVNEVRAERDAFVLSCMSAYISAVAANRDYQIHLLAVEELREFEKQYEALSGLGLRPQSDVLSARSERLQMESRAFRLEAALKSIISELRGALGLSKTIIIGTDWPTISQTLSAPPSDSEPHELPARKALTARHEESELESRAVNREIWVPELRVRPLFSGFGSDYMTLLPTTEWVASFVWSVPIENLLPGGKRKVAEALEERSAARLSEWDLRHAALLDGLFKQISALEQALSAQILSSEASDTAIEDILRRQAMGIVDSTELLQAERQKLQAHSEAISLKEQLLKLKFLYSIESGASWLQ